MTGRLCKLWMMGLVVAFAVPMLSLNALAQEKKAEPKAEAEAKVEKVADAEAVDAAVADAEAEGGMFASAAEYLAFEYVGKVLDKCCWGGDIRLRAVNFDDIPLNADPPGVTRGGENDFRRYRLRLWGQVDPTETMTLKLRLVNEFRDYSKPSGSTAWEWQEETVVDKLYFEWRDLYDGKMDVKIGRQDMIYGTGKVILEGTPKDGSRTIYFDAAKVSWTGVENNVIDVFGIYNQPENELVFNSQDRDLTGQDPRYNDITESGVGLYLKNNAVEDMPFEAYYVYKNESSWDRVVGGEPVPVAALDLNTIGARFMPTVFDGLTGNIELAMQFGERGNQSVEGMMADVFFNWAIPGTEKINGKLMLGVYYLSGDDPNSGRDEGWNPLWSRWPQYSELYIYAFDADGAGRWSNVMMPRIGFTTVPNKRIKAGAALSYMTAPEADGPGEGDERGLLFVFRTDFTLAEKMLTEQDKLFGHVVIETLDPGDYYNDERKMAHFARVELSYAF